MTTADPILQQFRVALTELYGDRIERVVLYGSRARGDDSDYDIALFLKGPTDTWEERDRIFELEESIRDATGADIRTMRLAGLQRTLLLHEIRKDGLDL